MGHTLPGGLDPHLHSRAPAAPGALAAPGSPASRRAHHVLLPELRQKRVSPTAQSSPGPRRPTHSPAMLRTLAPVGGSRAPSAQVRPSRPNTRPWGQRQVKLPAVLMQWCEQRVTPVLHSSTSS